MSDSLENTDTSSVDTQNVAIVEYGEFANYIRKAATILLPEEDATAPALNAVLDDKVNQDFIKKFLSDPQIQALYIQRTCSKGKQWRYVTSVCQWFYTYTAPIFNFRWFLFAGRIVVGIVELAQFFRHFRLQCGFSSEYFDLLVRYTVSGILLETIFTRWLMA